MEGHDLVYSISMTTRKPVKVKCMEENITLCQKSLRSTLKKERCLSMLSSLAIIIASFKFSPDLLTKVRSCLRNRCSRATQVREKMKDAVFIFIAPPSYDELLQRLVNRGD